MTGVLSSRFKTEAAEAVLVAIAHFIVAFGSLTLTRWSNGLASVWLPNATLLAYILLKRRECWPAACAGVLVSGVAANWLGGAPLSLALLFGLTNVFEPLAVMAVLRTSDRPVDFERMGDLARFALGVTLACAGSATAAAGAMAWAQGAAFPDAWISWFVSAGLGLLIGTPILLIGIREWLSGRIGRKEIVEGAAALGLVLAFALFVFGQTRWPLLFLLQPPVLFATFRLRALGAASATLLIAVIGTVAIEQASGPIALVHATFAERMAVFQAFLGLTILTAMPIAAVLTERDRVGKALLAREAEFRAVIEAVTNVIFRTDTDGRWTFLNTAWERLTGYPVEQTLGMSFLSPVIEEDRAEFLRRLEGLKAGLFDSVEYQFRFRTASGEERWAETRSHRLEGRDGELVGSAGILTDITDRVLLAAHLDEVRCKAERDAKAALLLASTDELTEVASRRAFLAYFEQQLCDAKASGAPLSVALFDIDHFKRVNDRHGHAAGDEVLKRVAAVARGCVRDRDLIGRLGGEEFAILMPQVSIAHAAAVAERLRIACAEADAEIPVTISVGVAAADQVSTTASLLKQADEALYRAKGEGRNCLRMAA